MSTSSLDSVLASGSTIETVVEPPTAEQTEASASPVHGEGPQSPQTSELLKLRLVPKRKKKKSKSVQWAQDVVDNEFLGRKSSKKCCIFHKRRQFGDWSDSDTDEECECEKQEMDAEK